jgi:hypothetical protein
MTLIKAAKQALEALEMLARYENPETKIQVRKPKDGGPIVTMYPHKVATDAADTLRTAIAEAEKQEPVAWSVQYPDDVERHRVTPSLVSDTKAELEEHFAGSAATKHIVPLYTIPPAAPVQDMQEPVAITEQQAHDMGATGAEPTDAERLLFEAWMKGHCWALCATWTGTQYRSDAEQSGDLDPRAMATRRLWAAWRDRAALATPPAAQQEPVAWIEHIAGGVEYSPYHQVATKLPEGVKFDLYTYPPAAQWVGLTDEEKEQATGWSVEHIEQALKEKNT